MERTKYVIVLFPRYQLTGNKGVGRGRMLGMKFVVLGVGTG